MTSNGHNWFPYEARYYNYIHIIKFLNFELGKKEGKNRILRSDEIDFDLLLPELTAPKHQKRLIRKRSPYRLPSSRQKALSGGIKKAKRNCNRGCFHPLKTVFGNFFCL
jgi:hypothetical protein